NDRTLTPVSLGQQHNPAICMDSQGNFVAVWEDDQDRNETYNIYMRGFSAGGCEQLAARRVNTVASGQQKSPAIAEDSLGNFVIVWEDDQDDNGKYQIYARAFFPNGNERFHDMTVNSESAGQQFVPNIALDEDGSFVAVWQDDADGNGYYEIVARGVEHYTIAPGNSYGGKIAGGVAVLPSGSFHSLQALADKGYTFLGWEGDVEDPHLTTTSVFVDADKTINARFGKKATLPSGAEESEITLRFALETNFPNPFNPRTTIHYEIAKTCFVTLKLYTVLGEEVAELVSQKQEPGRYDVQFGGSTLPSGVYFYRIVAGDFVNTKKMVLLK
ncbi:MAG: T9SS type A sorting domain-containing protein, partial [Ignavibacteriales bacterium]|nr:T9SS type A sorting domain-containing protein [Ignavibacteriales bacterium]